MLVVASLSTVVICRLLRLFEFLRCWDRQRPPRWIDSVRYQKREQPPLQAKCDAAAPRRPSVGKGDPERFSEEHLMVVERRDRQRAVAGKGEYQLVLETLDPLQCRAAAC